MSAAASNYAEAVALFRAGDLAGAERALTPVDAQSFDALHLMAGIKGARGEDADALALFDAALALKPDSAAAQNNRAGLLLAQARFAEAADGYAAALALRPDHAEAWYNRARALAMLDRNAEAVEVYTHAARLAPGNPDIAVDYGAALQALGRTEEARTQFDRALSLAPGHEGAKRSLAALQYNEGVALLRRGDYRDGFALYEQRRAAGAVAEPARSGGKPQWRGQHLEGALHVWSEMGVGEQILFASMLPLVRQRIARITLECDLRLAPLFARSFPFLEFTQDASNAEAQCALASLPFALNLSRETLTGAPYLKANEQRVAAIRSRYAGQAKGRPIIGIAWRSKNTLFGEKKSSKLEDWGALLREPALFVNLQYGDVRAELDQTRARFGCEIVDDPEIDQMRDLDGFAAQIAALDHVVSVSNTTVHMAGALGQRAIVLAPPERRLLWYWGDVGEITPWYQSLHLLAHDPAAGWPDHVARAAALLRETFRP